MTLPSHTCVQGPGTAWSFIKNNVTSLPVGDRVVTGCPQHSRDWAKHAPRATLFSLTGQPWAAGLSHLTADKTERLGDFPRDTQLVSGAGWLGSSQDACPRAPTGLYFLKILFIYF